MGRHPFPTLRFVALAWLAVYVPTYAHSYGLLNFLFLCNLGVILTGLGLWRGEPLLLSSQAVGAPAVCAAWMLDVAWRLLSGHHLFGGTAYMWDARYPLLLRLLSLYHVVWPFVLFYALRRTGYDRRGWALQSLLAAAAITASRLGDPASNINFAWVDPVFQRSFDPPWLHVAVILAALALPVYGLTHAALRRAFAPAPQAQPAMLSTGNGSCPAGGACGLRRGTLALLLGAAGAVPVQAAGTDSLEARWALRACATAVREESVRLCRQALELGLTARRAAVAQRLLGRSLADLTRWDEAVGAYREALRLEPADSEAAFRLGLALHYGLGRAQEAEPFLREAARECPEQVAYRVELAVVLNTLERHAEAAAEFQQALVQDARALDQRPGAQAAYLASLRGAPWP